MLFKKKKKGSVAAISLQGTHELTKEQKLFLIFAGSAMLFAVSIGMLFTITGMRMRAQLNERTAMVSQNSDATRVDRPCLIRLEAAFDVEPVDLALVSPSGILYDASTATSYYSDAGTVVMTLTATETGLWQVMSNQKTNTAVGVTFTTQYADQVFPQDVSVTASKDDNLTVAFTPMYRDGLTHRDFSYEITLSSQSTGQTATFGPYDAQSEFLTTQELDTSSLKSASDWELSISTQTGNAEAATLYTESGITCGKN